MKFRGIVLKSAMLATVGLIATGMSTAASAEIFNFNGSGTNSSNSAGNVRTFTGSEGTKVEVSGWALNGNSVIKSTVGKYNGYGLGSEHTANDDSHTIDNSGYKDFLVLQFDKAVTVSSLGIFGFGDTDLTYAVGTTGTPFSSTLSIANKTVLDSIFGSYVNSAGNTSNSLVSRAINAAELSGNIFLIGAGFNSGTNDSFKLSSATAELFSNNTAVPEPATWAMMIGGLGLVGSSMRRRKVVANFA